MFHCHKIFTQLELNTWRTRALEAARSSLLFALRRGTSVFLCFYGIKTNCTAQKDEQYIWKKKASCLYERSTDNGTYHKPPPPCRCLCLSCTVSCSSFRMCSYLERCRGYNPPPPCSPVEVWVRVGGWR